MVTSKSTQSMTPEAFLAFADQHPYTRFDFIDGEVVEVSPKFQHGTLQILIGHLLLVYLKNNPIGHVSSEVLHVLDDMKYLPDVSLNAAPPANGQYFTVPPLLAVEIRSDTQSREAQRRKARAYIGHGAQMVWLIMPEEQVEVYTQGSDEPMIYTKDDTLTGGDVLPGFEAPVVQLIGVEV